MQMKSDLLHLEILVSISILFYFVHLIIFGTVGGHQSGFGGTSSMF